jgi:hypothetical protein
MLLLPAPRSQPCLPISPPIRCPKCNRELHWCFFDGPVCKLCAGARYIRLKPPLEGMKFCIGCGKLVPLSDLSCNKSRCKKCNRATHVCISCKKEFSSSLRGPKARCPDCIARTKASKKETFCEGEKRCRSCQKILTFDHFRPHRSGRFGLNSWCKSCCAEDKRKRYAREHPMQKRIRKHHLPRWDHGPVPEGKKYCGKCRNLFDATTQFFYRSSTARNGLHNWCKACVNAIKQRSKKIVLDLNDGRRYCRHCKQAKEKTEFEADLTRFDGVSKWCKACLEEKRFIESIPDGSRYCKTCKQIKTKEQFGRIRCKLCNKFVKRESLRRACHSFYCRNKEKIKSKYYGGLDVRALRNRIDNALDENGKASGYTHAQSESARLRTAQRRLDRLQTNIRAAMEKGVEMPEIAVRVAMERLKGSSGKNIGETLGVSAATVGIMLRLFEGKANAKDISSYLWGKQLVNSGVLILDGIHYTRPKKPPKWTSEDSKTLEEMLRNGLTPGGAKAKMNNQLATGWGRRKLNVLYLKFGRMMRKRQIKTDWTEGGKYSQDSVRYKRNREEAINSAKRRLGLHPLTVKEVILATRKYNEPLL